MTSIEWKQLIDSKCRTCPMCGKSFCNARSMRKHIRRVHFNEKVECKHCGKLVKRESMRLHMQIHLGTKKIAVKNIECHYCGAKFTAKHFLSDHIASHMGIKNHKCHMCDKEYSCRKSLKSHLLLHKSGPIIDKPKGPLDTGDYNIDQWNEFIQNRTTVCPECGKDYRTPRNMRKHLRRVHVSVKRFKCEDCGRLLKSQDSLRTHRVINHLGRARTKALNYECAYCGKAFASKPILSDHISVHTGIKNHVCPECNKGYSCAAGLRLHNIKAHLQFSGVPIKKLKCDLCDKDFFDRKSLNKHRNWVHGDKYHLCKVCGARIRGSLKQHMITHSGERKYCCHICGKKLRGKLKEHMLTHTGERPYACEVCGSTFKTKWYLTVHMRTHNGIRPYSCEFCGQKFAARSSYTSHLRKHTGANKKNGNEFVCQVCRTSFTSLDQLNEHLREHFGLNTADDIE